MMFILIMLIRLKLGLLQLLLSGMVLLKGVKDVVYSLGQVFVDGIMYQQYPLKEEMLKNKSL